MGPRPRLLACIAVCLAATIPCWAQRTPSSDTTRSFYIQGSVRRNDDQRTVEMVKVDLKKFTGETVSTTFTRSNGEFEFTNLSVGHYHIVIEEKGFETVDEFVDLSNGPRTGVVIWLRRPIEVGQTEAAGPKISKHELSLPSKVRDIMKKGMEQLYEKKDFKTSIDFFNRAVASAPAYYEAYFQMGIAYTGLGQMEEAERAFRKSIEVSENHYAEPLTALGAIFCNEKKFAEAEPLLSRSLELNADSWQAHFEMARAQVGLNQVDAAEKNAMEARSKKADEPQIHLVLANIHIRKRNYTGLLEDLDTYIKLDPNGAMAAQARDLRSKVQEGLAKAQNTPAQAPPKP
jgi:Tfp pilus assembly protein PilF